LVCYQVFIEAAHANISVEIERKKTYNTYIIDVDYIWMIRKEIYSVPVVVVNSVMRRKI
jgi:hypothetical protein